ncbi:MAG: hypothetical protein ACRCT8_06960 [Lacipirellulaceae bacterium]
MVSITGEQLEALAQAGGASVELRDPMTSKVYVLFEVSPAPEADAAHIEYMLQGLEEAGEAVARGDVTPWDKEAFLNEMHRKADRA